MTIITQSFLTRVFFITIILEVHCNNSEALEKYLKCLFFFFLHPKYMFLSTVYNLFLWQWLEFPRKRLQVRP